MSSRNRCDGMEPFISTLITQRLDWSHTEQETAELCTSCESVIQNIQQLDHTECDEWRGFSPQGVFAEIILASEHVCHEYLLCIYCVLPLGGRAEQQMTLKHTLNRTQHRDTQTTAQFMQN